MADYATKAQLAGYLGILEAELPADADRKLRLASELVDDMILPNEVDPENEVQALAAQNATCAIIDEWITAETVSTASSGGEVKSYTVGETRVEYSTSSNVVDGISKQAVDTSRKAERYLLRAGLLFRGIASGPGLR